MQQHLLVRAHVRDASTRRAQRVSMLHAPTKLDRISIRDAFVEQRGPGVVQRMIKVSSVGDVRGDFLHRARENVQPGNRHHERVPHLFRPAREFVHASVVHEQRVVAHIVCQFVERLHQ